MKNTDKITLTIDKLKKLIKESKSIKEARKYDGFELKTLIKQYNGLSDLIENYQDFRGIIEDLIDIIEDDHYDSENFDNENYEELKSEYYERLKNFAKLSQKWIDLYYEKYNF